MKKGIFFSVLYGLITTLFCISGLSQSFDLHLEDLSRMPFKTPSLLGKAGDRIMLLDPDFVNGTGGAVYMLDSNLQLAKRVFLPRSAADATSDIIGNSIRFTKLALKNDSVYANIVQVTNRGFITNHIIAFGTTSQYDRSVNQVDKNQQYQLLGSLHLDSAQVTLNGVLLDSLGGVDKTLSYAFDFDPSLNQEPIIKLDSKGNVHIAVWDRLSNYRISTSVTINTIPYREEDMITESYRFEKVKFNRMAFTDDPERGTIQLRGIYYDAAEKDKKKGIASLQFSYKRGTPIESRFNAFPTELRATLKKHMPHLRRQDDVLNSISLKDIVDENGRTMISFWAHDISQLDLITDYESDKARENEQTRILPIGNQASAIPGNDKDLNRWLNDAVRVNMPMERNLQYYLPGQIPNQQNGFSELALFTPVVGNGLSDAERNNIFDKMDGWSKDLNTLRKIKLVSFVINESGVMDNYSIIDSDFFLKEDPRSTGSVSYSFIKGGQALYGANRSLQDNGASFSLVVPDKTETPQVKRFSLPLADSYIFPPKKVGPLEYAFLLRNNKTNEFSLLLMKNK